MSYEQKPGQYSLFRNNKKNDKQPDYRGTICLPDGTQMEIAGWQKHTRNGDVFISGKVSEIRQRTDQPADHPRATDDKPQAEANGGDFFDDIPFAPVDWRTS